MILAGERLAQSPGALSAAVRLAAATSARLAWVPRRAGERGALDAGAFPTLLPGGRPVADPGVRADLSGAWGVQVPSAPGRDTDAILQAALRGELDALVVAGVDPADLPDPALAREAIGRVPLLVSLELRRSAVTELADIVLPVASAMEKAGTFYDWEGRPRPFEQALDTAGAARPAGARPDRRRDGRRRSGCPTSPAARRELAALGLHRGARPPAPTVAPPRLPVPGPGRGGAGDLALAAGRGPDAGRRAAPGRDGEQARACTCRRPRLPRWAPPRANSSRSSSERGSLVLPLVLADMPDRVVWVPTNAPGYPVRERLAAGSGAIVRVSRAQVTEAQVDRGGRSDGGSDFSIRGRLMPTVPGRRPAEPRLVRQRAVLADAGQGRGRFHHARGGGAADRVGRAPRRRLHAAAAGPEPGGPVRLLQSLMDGVKLMLKEDLVPAAADLPVYVLAPIIAAVPALMAFSVIPFGPVVSIAGHKTPLQLTDLPIGILFILAMSSLGIYGIVLSGWSSGSTYPLLGGLRSAAQMISYEVAMAIAIAPVFLYSATLATSGIVASQTSHWYFWVLPVSFILYGIAAVGETNRAPFDLPEAETELVGGFHTEYSSIKFAFFFLAEYINMVTVSAVATTLFLGGWRAPWPLSVYSGFNEGWWPLLWFWGKVVIFLFVFIWLRGTLPRLRYDQFMRFGWKVMIPIGLLWLLGVAYVRTAQIHASNPRAWYIVGGIVAAVLLVLFALDPGHRKRQRAAEREERERLAKAPSLDRIPWPPAGDEGAVGRPPTRVISAGTGPRQES